MQGRKWTDKQAVKTTRGEVNFEIKSERLRVCEATRSPGALELLNVEADGGDYVLWRL